MAIAPWSLWSAALVWLPGAAYLLLHGEILKGVLLIAWGDLGGRFHRQPHQAALHQRQGPAPDPGDSPRRPGRSPVFRAFWG